MLNNSEIYIFHADDDSGDIDPAELTEDQLHHLSILHACGIFTMADLHPHVASKLCDKFNNIGINNPEYTKPESIKYKILENKTQHDQLFSELKKEIDTKITESSEKIKEMANEMKTNMEKSFDKSDTRNNKMFIENKSEPLMIEYNNKINC